MLINTAKKSFYIPTPEKNIFDKSNFIFFIAVHPPFNTGFESKQSQRTLLVVKHHFLFITSKYSILFKLIISFLVAKFPSNRFQPW